MLNQIVIYWSESMKNRLTVIHSIPNWLPQTETWLYSQVKYLPDNEVEGHVVCEQTSNLDQFYVPNIHCRHQGSDFGYYLDKCFRKLNLRNNSDFLVQQAGIYKGDILHSHFGNVGWNNIQAAKRSGLRHVVTFYGFDVSMLPRLDPIWYQRYRELFNSVDLILCEGPYMAKCIVDLGCPEHKVHVHHLGVQVHEIAFQPRSWSPGEPLNVLISAIFREKKGIPYALKALGRIQPKVKLNITIIGDATNELRDQREKESIIHLIEQWQLGSRVRLLGFQPHIILMQEAYKHHIFISPSVTAANGDTEGGAPVTIIEMMATGMPVVSTVHCDIPEVIQHGVSGLLANERDVDGLERYLSWLIDNPDNWSILEYNARKHIEQQYDCLKQGTLLYKQYRGLVDF